MHYLLFFLFAHRLSIADSFISFLFLSYFMAAEEASVAGQDAPAPMMSGVRELR